MKFVYTPLLSVVFQRGHTKLARVDGMFLIESQLSSVNVVEAGSESLRVLKVQYT